MNQAGRALTRCRSTELEMRAPFSITHSMPMDTLGPILQSRPILADGCRMTLPSISGPWASSSGALRRSDARCSCRPAGCRTLCQNHFFLLWVGLWQEFGGRYARCSCKP